MKIKVFVILLFFFSLFNALRTRLPYSEDIDDRLYMQPVQVEAEKEPFEVTKGGITYTVEPLYAYSLFGLIVTEKTLSSRLDYYHSQWKDSLNIKDICVIWGENLRDDNFRELKYKSGSWTCYVSSRSRQTWQKFKSYQLSNNHLLAQDPAVIKQIRGARRGDQVALKGYLANYSHDEGFQRKTSVTRSDGGGTACEVIYVEDFEIITRHNPLWHMLYGLSKWALILWTGWCFISLFVAPKSYRHLLKRQNRK